MNDKQQVRQVIWDGARGAGGARGVGWAMPNRHNMQTKSTPPLAEHMIDQILTCHMPQAEIASLAFDPLPLGSIRISNGGFQSTDTCTDTYGHQRIPTDTPTLRLEEKKQEAWDARLEERAERVWSAGFEMIECI